MSSSLCPRVHNGHSELDGAALPRRYQQQHGALRPSLSHLCESPEVPSTAPAWQGEGVTAGFACHELPTLLSISALGPGRDGASCSWHRRSSPPGAEPSAWQGQPHLLGRRQKLGNLPAFLQLSGWRHHPVAPRGLLCVCTKRRDKGTLLPHRPRHPAQPSPRICCPCTGLLAPRGLGGVVPQLSGGLGLPCQGVIVAETNCLLHHISLLCTRNPRMCPGCAGLCAASPAPAALGAGDATSPVGHPSGHMLDGAIRVSWPLGWQK